MASKLVLLNIETEIATITFNREQKHNAMNLDFIHELDQALSTIKQAEAIKLVVLQANGKSFCAGADLNWMQQSHKLDASTNLDEMEKLANMYANIANLPIPTLAIVQGSVYGGGVGLIACCDIAIAMTDCKFALPEVKLGLVPGVIAPYLQRKIGYSWSNYYCLTGISFNAETAKKHGLIHEITTIAELNEIKEEIINNLLGNDTTALQHSKAILKQLVVNPNDLQTGTQNSATARMNATNKIKKFLTADKY